MADAPKPKIKGGRPKKPPSPPVLGVALRQGDGRTVIVVLAGLVVNGKKWEPQAGADLLAEMLLDVVRGRVTLGATPAPIADYGDGAAPVETAGQDLPVVHPATNGGAAGGIDVTGDGAPSPELAIAPGENGSH